jgi:SAM-dependent methyltransferase
MAPLRRILRAVSASAPFEALARRRRTSDLEAARESLIASAEITNREKEILSGASLETHALDTMYEKGRGEHYLGVGLSALRALDRVISEGPEPTSVLDFASGYGRVLRLLMRRFEGARVVACEIDPTAVEYCVHQFGVQAVLSENDLSTLSLRQKFDLIWCGSLITHLDEGRARDLLAFVERHLTDRGVGVLSVHGEVTVEALRAETNDYGLAPGSVASLLAGYEATGYGHASYGGHDGYGISAVSVRKLDELASEARLSRRTVQARGWDDHHDVYDFVRSGD